MSNWQMALVGCWLACAAPLSLEAQTPLSWSSLQQCELPSGLIRYTHEVASLDRQLVQVKGYIIPLDADGRDYALSAYPMIECFFCGNAGPTSIIELVMKDAKRYKVDALKTFEGELVLSPGSQGMIFRLESAVER